MEQFMRVAMWFGLIWLAVSIVGGLGLAAYIKRNNRPSRDGRFAKYHGFTKN